MQNVQKSNENSFLSKIRQKWFFGICRLEFIQEQEPRKFFHENFLQKFNLDAKYKLKGIGTFQ